MMSSANQSPTQLLATPVQYLKGVGPRRAELLKRLGLRTACDVIFYFPRSYQDLTQRCTVAELQPGVFQSVEGTVEEVEYRRAYSGKTILGVLVACSDGYVRALWFNQAHMRNKFHQGQRVVLSGKPRRNGPMWELAHPLVQTLTDEEAGIAPGLLPIYPLTEGLQQWQLRRIVRAAVEQYADVLEEAFPDEFRRSHNLWPIARAVREIHFPADHDSLAQARRRFVYQELFILQLALAVKRKQEQTRRRAPQLEADEEIDSRIRSIFPFELTAGQKQAIAEISADMARPVPMGRLVQGDVGSGKTVVAVYAMLLAAMHGYQAVMMAPTEVLARQHYQTLNRLLGGSRFRRALLTGGMSARLRKAVLEQVATGQIDLIVGTQAIVQGDVRFHRVGLVVIDEQHKFGVRQRAALKQAAEDPHYLVMTATPIPRTMTMTLFGDLDVSVIADSPPGRQKVRTYLVRPENRDKWWEFFRKQLRKGRQGYVVTPLVEDSAQLDVASLEAAYEALANGQLEAFRLGLIHGRMSSSEKDAVMERFRSGDIQVLVCTSVVEVGVDVPNATLMTIEGAERFGLAQLHQLRGRITRGRFPGHCGVFADPQTDEARRRLKAFTSCTDGFRLAEVDFALRGPGELLGTRQHGVPPLRIADLRRDTDLLVEAREDAQALVDADPGLSLPEHNLLRRMVLARYGKLLDLGHVG